MTIRINNQDIKHFVFSGGECHVDISHINFDGNVDVVAYLYSSDDIMCLLMSIDAIRQRNEGAKINLTVPYLPYARQDRVCNKGEAFSLSVIATMINNLNCETVTLYDPHSQVSYDLIKNCRVLTQTDLIRGTDLLSFIRQHNLTLVSPDAGSESKIKNIQKTFDLNAIFCKKIRDSETREIIKTEIPDDLESDAFIIIDDICDGGRTFVELAKALQKKGAKTIYLYVTHGIFSQGLKSLKPYFNHIYCHHSFLKQENLDPKFLTIIEGNNNEN